ncbi:MAG: RidA family protein [Oscillospiraceae bacterium]|nr:RidA family protein [Oscillospiraceae bacterium]
MLDRVSTPKAPAAIGPYSQAVWAGNFLYLSGMMPIDPETGALEPADITLQAQRIMKNIEAVLSEAGLTQENVVKTTCFLSDMANFGAFNAVYGAYFTSKPARSCVAVRELPKSALVEVEVIAYKG